VELRQGEAFNDLLRSCTREAFHLEVKDSYLTPDDTELLQRFLDGEPDDYAWMNGWAQFVGELTASGVAVRRARVVTVPHSDWTRWGLDVSAVNVAAGEEVRYLPRHRIAADEVTRDDWWLLDGERVAFTIEYPDGRWAGAGVTTEPGIVARCRAVRDRVWDLAVPRADYVAANQR
jgi:hypothetical protein